MLCKSFKIIVSQSSASDTIPLCFSTASKIKNIKCPPVNQKWWDRLMNIYSEKTPRSSNISVHHRPALKNLNSWLLKENWFKYFSLFVWSICILVYKIKNLFLEKVLDVFLTSYFSITGFPEYFFFLNSISYFSHMISQYFKFWKFLFFLIFKKISFIPFKEGWSVTTPFLAETILY